MTSKNTRYHKLRVSIIEPLGSHGGMDYYNTCLCFALAKKGVDVTLYTSGSVVTKDLNKPFRIKYTYKNVYGNKSRILRGLKYIFATALSLLESKFSKTRICHFHLFTPGPLETFNILLAKMLRMDCVVTAHDIESLDENIKTRIFPSLCYRIADKIIVHNKWSRDTIKGKFNVAEGKISIIPHGNYLPLINSIPPRSKARKKLNIPDNAKIFLFFGHIKKVKGLDLLIEAMPMVLNKYPEAKLLIAGRPWKIDYQIYREMINRTEIHKNCIEKICFIPHNEISFYFAASDLVVLPYRKIYQSGVMILAMSYNKPILISDLPPAKEIIKDGINGFLFQAGNSFSLAQEICSVISNPEKMEEVASNGYNFVITKLDWNVIGLLTKKTYLH